MREEIIANKSRVSHMRRPSYVSTKDMSVITVPQAIMVAGTEDKRERCPRLERRTQTPSGRPKHFEEDVPFHSVSAAIRRCDEVIRRYVYETIWYLASASHGLHAGHKKIKVLQRRLRLQCCSVGRRGEGLSPSQLLLRNLLVGSDTGNKSYS